MTPETKAREKIDDKLTQAGWVVQSMKALNLGAATGVAVREFPTDSGPADYLLFVNRVRSFKEMAPQARSWRAPAVMAWPTSSITWWRSERRVIWPRPPTARGTFFAELAMLPPPPRLCLCAPIHV